MSLSKIFLAPVSNIGINSNFDRTLLNGVKLNNTLVHLWGIQCHNKTWESLTPNDFVFFYYKGQIFCYGIVKEKFIDRDLSNKLWGTFVRKGLISYWEKIISFSKISGLALQYDILKSYANYKPKATVRFFHQYSDFGLNRILKEYDNIMDFIIEYSV